MSILVLTLLLLLQTLCQDALLQAYVQAAVIRHSGQVAFPPQPAI